MNTTIAFALGAGAAFAFCFMTLLLAVYAARRQSKDMREQVDRTHQLLSVANQHRRRNADSLDRIATALERKNVA